MRSDEEIPFRRFWRQATSARAGIDEAGKFDIDAFFLFQPSRSRARREIE
jgi:hypothetical protein